jgi:hypothetical protein
MQKLCKKGLKLPCDHLIKCSDEDSMQSPEATRAECQRKCQTELWTRNRVWMIRCGEDSVGHHDMKSADKVIFQQNIGVHHMTARHEDHVPIDISVDVHSQNPCAYSGGA